MVNPSITPGKGILHVSSKKRILTPHTSLQSYLHQGCFVHSNPSWTLPNLHMSRLISKKNSINTGNRNAPAAVSICHGCWMLTGCHGRQSEKKHGGSFTQYILMFSVCFVKRALVKLNYAMASGTCQFHSIFT